MYYVFTQSTDDRDPRTTVYKTRSLNQAKSKYHSLQENLSKRNNYTYPNPETSRNWHHTFVYVYQLSGRVDTKDSIFNRRGSSTYPRGFSENLFSYVREHGEKIEFDVED